MSNAQIARELRAYPPSKYGRMYVPRGYATSTFGASARTATAEQRAARRAYNYHGVGAYSVGRNWRKFSQSIGLSKAGKQVVMAGAKAASTIIGAAPRMMGMGGYTTNSLMVDDGVSDMVPRVSGTGDETGAVIVSRREYIQDIYAPASGISFQNQSFPINPGLEQTFPWLSQIAANYEEYELLQCIFAYRSTTSDATSATGQCGTVIMATQYNCSSAAFTDKPAMLEYTGAMSTKSSETMLHGVECDPRKLSDPGNTIRTGPVPQGADVKTYDHATLNVAVTNTPSGYAGGVLGELWVSYTVKLKLPKFAVGRGALIGRDLFVSAKDESVTYPFGPAGTMLAAQQNNIGCSLTYATNSIIVNFPNAYSGYIRVIIRLEGVTSTNTIMTGASQTKQGNVRDIYDMYGGFTDSSDTPRAICTTPVGAVTSGVFHYEHHVFISPATAATTNAIQYTLSNISSAPTQASIEILEYNGSFSSRAMNVGPASSQTDTPLLIDPSGAVIVPT